ncbi:elongation factor Ts [Patescibacteria group bacterium]|nr:elongation factor Ts [Patescibacteria group bacterium]
MTISIELIKKLREFSGAGINDVKEALAEAGGDEEKATVILKKKGKKIAVKRSERSTGEGLIESYVHVNGKIGVLVAVICETDFVARNKEFKDFVHELALQVAATDPSYLTPDEIPQEELNKEKEIYRQQLIAEGKLEGKLNQIIEGKLQKYYSEVCLLKQLYIKDDKITIEALLENLIAKMGENIKIKQFVRLSL